MCDITDIVGTQWTIVTNTNTTSTTMMDLNYYLATPLDKLSGRPSPSWERLNEENNLEKGLSFLYFYGVIRGISVKTTKVIILLVL